MKTQILLVVLGLLILLPVSVIAGDTDSVPIVISFSTIWGSATGISDPLTKIGDGEYEFSIEVQTNSSNWQVLIVPDRENALECRRGRIGASKVPTEHIKSPSFSVSSDYHKIPTSGIEVMSGPNAHYHPGFIRLKKLDDEPVSGFVSFRSSKNGEYAQIAFYVP